MQDQLTRQPCIDKCRLLYFSIDNLCANFGSKKSAIRLFFYSLLLSSSRSASLILGIGSNSGMPFAGKSDKEVDFRNVGVLYKYIKLISLKV